MDRTLEERLLVEARKAAERAHRPYSGFAVGAAVAGRDGRVHAGCNVENSSFGLTCCAERTALFRAVAEGQAVGELETLLVYVAGERAYSSCGACRQVMLELMHPEARVICRCDGTDRREVRVGALLPDPFRLDDGKAPD